jgi:hypothetical protein
MKTLVALLLAIAAISAQAIPIQLMDFAQNNWELRLFLYVTDSETAQPLVVDAIRINGVVVETEKSELIGGVGLLWETLPGNLGFVYGLNTFSVVEGGITYQGPSFTLTQPTGPRPDIDTRVPDIGATALLLCLSVVGVHFIAASKSQRGGC